MSERALEVLAPGMGIRILGHGRAWPETAVSNADLLARHPRTRGKPRSELEAMGKRLEARFGIGRRYLTRLPGEAPDPASASASESDSASPSDSVPELSTSEETSQSLALRASRQAVAPHPGRPVGALVHGTTTSSRYTGSQAPVILAALHGDSDDDGHGDDHGHGAAYEIKAGCSTSLASLHLAFSLLSMGHEDVLVSCAETLSKVIHPALRDTWFVLADGGAAVWMQRDDATPDFEIRRLLYHTDGRHADLFTTHGKLPPSRADLEAHGYALFGDAAALRAQALRRYRMMLERMFPGGAGLERIRWLIPHQINRGLIEEALYRDTALRADMLWSADTHGNLGGTSILFTLAEALAENRFRPGDEILLASVGGGLSFAMQHWVKR